MALVLLSFLDFLLVVSSLGVPLPLFGILGHLLFLLGLRLGPEALFDVRGKDADHKDADDDDALDSRAYVHPAAEHQLNADEDQDDTQAVRQQVEHLDKVLHDEERRPQAKHGQDAGAESYVLVWDLCNLRADAVQGKDDVGELHDDDHDKEQRQLQLACRLVPDEYAGPLIVVGVHDAAAAAPLQEPHQARVLDVPVVVVLAPDRLDAAPHKHGSERPSEPADRMQQRGDHHEEDQAHDHCANDADKDSLVHLRRRCLVGLKHKVEYEEVVHRQHPLQDVARNPLDAGLLAHARPDDPQVEHCCNHPDADHHQVPAKAVRRMAQDQPVEQAEGDAHHGQDDPVLGRR
mmetsp:Transcript_57615/g.171460  ORF Transcript_57615/g.171460 Transcript_57615/m.171460 type:complete len:348 (+) Transcript_57615:406-1449(+)